MREGVEDLLAFAKTQGPLMMISGDTDRERQRWESVFKSPADLFENELFFHQSPADKLHLLESADAAGHKVLYLGDGLNDAGALRAAHVGVAVADEGGGFNPACDAVLSASQVSRFDRYWRFLKQGRGLVLGALSLAIVYNIAGLGFAMTGRLEPVVAAILMPLSSLSVIGYAWISTWIAGQRSGI